MFVFPSRLVVLLDLRANAGATGLEGYRGTANYRITKSKFAM
jgi:hypothetical protein